MKNAEGKSLGYERRGIRAPPLAECSAVGKWNLVCSFALIISNQSTHLAVIERILARCHANLRNQVSTQWHIQILSITNYSIKFISSVEIRLNEDAQTIGGAAGSIVRFLQATAARLHILSVSLDPHPPDRSPAVRRYLYTAQRMSRQLICSVN